VVALSSLLQPDLSTVLGILNPLDVPARGNEVPSAVNHEQIDWGGIQTPRLSPPDLQEIVMRQAKAEANEDTEELIKHLLQPTWLVKYWYLFRH
jgi:hypothetical protein